MKCPHCRVEVHAPSEYIALGKDADDRWNILKRTCPACNKFIIHLTNGQPLSDLPGSQIRGIKDETVSIMVRPKNNSRPPCPPEVPKDIAKDYTQAHLVLSDSPEASATLSRRCLQNLLIEVAKVDPKKTLEKQIQEVLDSKALPASLASEIDAIRNVGNFAAHPLKSQVTNQILPVEPEEAEWNLNVLDGLFNFYYVELPKSQKRISDLNQKLAQAGKPPMK